MLKPESRGLINGKRNVLEYPCREANHSVPYFKDISSYKELDKINYADINKYLTSIINMLHE